MRLNHLKISVLSMLALFIGNKAQGQTYTDESFSATWSMANGESSTALISPAEAIQSTSWSIASDLTLNSNQTGSYFDKTFTLFTRVGSSKLDNNRSNLNNSYVEFKFKPAAGLTVTPTTLNFDIVKVGTGDPQIWVECLQGSTTTSVAGNVTIRKTSESSPSEHLSYDLSSLTTLTASSDETIIRIFIGKLANDKQVGIANLVLEGKLNGTIEKFTTVYNLATAISNYGSNIEGKTGSLPATTADAAANAPELQVDAMKGKLGANGDWAQINVGTILTLPGVPQGATVSFVLYSSTGLTIKGLEYTNGQTYTAAKDENLVMECTTGGYIKTITVEGTAFVTVLDTEGYTNTWFFGKSNGAPEFALQKSAEYNYEVEGRSLVINTASGKLNNASRTDQWAQCNDGTLFKVPVYAGSKLTWGRYNGGSETGFNINDVLFNEYYIATEEGTVDMTAKGISYLSFIKIAPETLYDITGSITGGSIDNATITLTAANGQGYQATIESGTFTMKVPAGTYSIHLSNEVPYVVSSPENITVSSTGDVGTITIVSAEPQTLTGQITNAPAEAFTLTFTGNSHSKQLECEAGATSYTVVLDPDTYTISSSVGELSPLSKVSFQVLKEAANHNIYFPESAVPAATQQNITVDNTATVVANVYNTVTDALAAAKAGNIANPVITLTSGQTYQEQVIVDMPGVTLKTSGEEKATITFYYGIGYTYYSLGENGYYDKDRANTRNSILMKDPSRWGASVLITYQGNNFKAENIIFENSFNQRYTAEEIVDGVRPNGCQGITYDRTLNDGETGYYAADAKQVTERAAAIAFENNPSGCQLYKCRFVGSQDTFYSSGKIYVKDCDIIGNTDYIFGGGYVVFDDCNLEIGGYSDKKTTAYITAQKGSAGDAYIFRDCTVTSGARTYVSANLGRDWGGADATVYFFNLKNELGSDMSYSWTNMSGGVSAGTANLHIFDFDAAINANYNTTGSTGANINGVLSDENALDLYASVVSKLGFTPEHIYDGVLELNENSAYNVCRIAANNDVTRDIKLTREMNAGQWYAITLPFDITQDDIQVMFGNGTKVAMLTSADATSLNYTSVAAIEANKPYIINIPSGYSYSVMTSTVVNAASSQSAENWTVTGTYATTIVPAGSYYISEEKVVKATGDTESIKAFDVYFTNNDATGAVSITIDGTPTDISNTLTPASTDTTIYTLQGVRVDKARKGLYIVNGKKIVVK